MEEDRLLEGAESSKDKSEPDGRNNRGGVYRHAMDEGIANVEAASSNLNLSSIHMEGNEGDKEKGLLPMTDPCIMPARLAQHAKRSGCEKEECHRG